MEKNIYTSKEITPPIVALSANFAPGDLTSKVFGMSEYDSSKMEYAMQLQLQIIQY